MKLNIWIVLCTIILIYNEYNENKLILFINDNKRTGKIVMYCFISFCILLFINKNPIHGRDMIKYAHNAITFIPKENMRSYNASTTPTHHIPTQHTQNMSYSTASTMPTHELSGETRRINTGDTRRINTGDTHRINTGDTRKINIGETRMLNSGNGSSKRCVSETKKKYVAAQQGWRCGECQCTLDAWFEIDHTKRLDNGGDNNVENLVAMCRNCHGKKTAMENML
jgi:hypothetical protein